MTVDRLDEDARAAMRADVRLRAALAARSIVDADRLDDRTRHLVSRSGEALIVSIEIELRHQAARLLSGRGAQAAAEVMMNGRSSALSAHHDLLSHPPLLEELIARARLSIIAASVRMEPSEPEQSSLLVRLVDLPDRLVSRAARALLIAEAGDVDGDAIGPLPAELHHWLVWHVAAAIRASYPCDEPTDRALSDAARRALAAHEEGDGAGALAVQLAGAIDALPHELPSLLCETLVDRRLTLFIAVLARALDVDASAIRELVLDSEDERLWRALRAAGLDRDALARIGFALTEADPRRDLDAFIEQLDALAATDPAQCRTSLGAIALPHELRRATRTLSKTP